jgi:hypothetical protein
MPNQKLGISWIIIIREADHTPNVNINLLKLIVRAHMRSIEDNVRIIDIQGFGQRNAKGNSGCLWNMVEYDCPPLLIGYKIFR